MLLELDDTLFSALKLSGALIPPPAIPSEWGGQRELDLPAENGRKRAPAVSPAGGVPGRGSLLLAPGIGPRGSARARHYWTYTRIRQAAE